MRALPRTALATLTAAVAWLNCLHSLAADLAFQTISVDGVMSLEVPADWPRMTEEQVARIAKRIPSERAEGVEEFVSLPGNRRLTFLSNGGRGPAGMVIALRDAEEFVLTKADLPLEGEALSPDVVRFFDMEIDKQERSLAANGGAILERFPARMVSLGAGAIGVECGHTSRQGATVTVARQVVAFAGSFVLFVTYSYRKAAEGEYEPLFARVRSSIRPL